MLKSAPVKAALKSAKKSAIKTAGAAAKDLLSGKNPKANASLNLKAAQHDIENAVIGAMAKKPKTGNANLRPNRKRKGPVIASKPAVLPKKIKKPLI